jgi:hypothetical protein
MTQPEGVVAVKEYAREAAAPLISVTHTLIPHSPPPPRIVLLLADARLTNRRPQSVCEYPRPVAFFHTNAGRRLLSPVGLNTAGRGHGLRLRAWSNLLHCDSREF